MKVLPDICLTTIRKYHKQSAYTVYRKTKNGWKVLENAKKDDFTKLSRSENKTHNQAQKSIKDEISVKNDEIATNAPNLRRNEMQIQMLSKSLYDQIFQNNPKNTPDEQQVQR